MITKQLRYTPAMKSTAVLSLLILSVAISGWAQTKDDPATFKIALPSRPGQLRWHADGFKIVESSAKANGREIGIRGKDESGRLTFLGFLFLVPEEAPLTSQKCQDEAIKMDKKGNPSLKILAASSIENPESLPTVIVNYTVRGENGTTAYRVRGFIATGDICGDLEFYSERPISGEDADLKKIFASYHFDPNYVPQFEDAFLYAQILYQHHMFRPAAPIFEQALTLLKDDMDHLTMRRVTIDQAGMAYGVSGDIPKARALFNAAIAKDPDYPMYYYNLACADAEEKDLADARLHLEQAFTRKANVIAGEKMPDPTKDDSFLPYRKNKEFWKFIETLR